MLDLRLSTTHERDYTIFSSEKSRIIFCVNYSNLLEEFHFFAVGACDKCNMYRDFLG